MVVRGAIKRGCEGARSATFRCTARGLLAQSSPGAVRPYDGMIACGWAVISRIDSTRPLQKEVAFRTTTIHESHEHHTNLKRHKISRRPRHPVSVGREARRDPHGRGVHNGVIGGWSSGTMAWPAGAELITSGVDSRRRRKGGIVALAQAVWDDGQPHRPITSAR